MKDVDYVLTASDELVSLAREAAALSLRVETLLSKLLRDGTDPIQGLVERIEAIDSIAETATAFDDGVTLGTGDSICIGATNQLREIVAALRAFDSDFSKYLIADGHEGEATAACAADDSCASATSQTSSGVS